jgi:hypothetical protein
MLIWLLDPSSPGSGLQIMYTNGDRCFLNKIQRPRIAIVQFHCSDIQSDTFTVHEDSTTCTFTMTIETPYACWPRKISSSGFSFGTQALIM